NISAALADADGSESLSIEVTNVPPGAQLSAGTQVALGDYVLSPAQLAGLTIRPAAGSAQPFVLTVTATSTESANHDQAHISASLGVTVNTVVVNPLTVTGFVVNNGQAQRSEILTLQVVFNQDVLISDPASDITVVSAVDGSVIHVPAGSFT